MFALALRSEFSSGSLVAEDLKISKEALSKKTSIFLRTKNSREMNDFDGCGILRLERFKKNYVQVFSSRWK